MKEFRNESAPANYNFPGRQPYRRNDLDLSAFPCCHSTRHRASYAWLVPVGNPGVILFSAENRFSGDWKGGNEISRGNLKRVCAGKKVEMKGEEEEERASRDEEEEEVETGLRAD